MSLRRRIFRRPISLRSHLTVLVLVTMVPLLIFSGLMIYLLAERERDTFQKGATERTRALITAVDVALKGSITALDALASNEDLRNSNVRGFYDAAARVLKTQPDWLTINLADRSGQQIMNLLRPFGADLPKIQDVTEINQVLETGRPLIGNILLGPVTKQHDFAVRVPVFRNGVLTYVLSAVIKPQSIGALLSAQSLPSDWIGVVVDANNRFVTRGIGSDQIVGQLASESLRAALARSSDGWFRGTTIEGWSVYTPYNRSPFSGWTVAMGIPASVVDAPLHGPVLYMTFLGAALVLLGVALAWWLSSKTAGSIESLVNLATNLGLGKDTAAAPPPAAANDVPSHVTEIDHLRETFLTAGRIIQERSQDRGRLEEALRHDIAQRERAERFLLLQIATSRALTDSVDLTSATPKIVQAICELTGWEVGAIWDVDREANELVSVGVWHLPTVGVPEFEAASRRLRFTPGLGLAGRVWASGEPAWIADVTKDDNFLRISQALKEGLRAGVCFPITVGTEVLGVIECFSHEIREPDREILETLANIGVHLGQFIERKRAQEALSESQARLSGIINSAMDAVIAVDHLQRIVLFNPAAEEMFGCTATDALGNSLERFIPPRFREAHNEHIEKFSRTGVTSRRMGALGALSALRSNGEEFPIEASISQLEIGAEKLFTVILRDITARKQAENEIAQLNEDLERRVAQRTRELQEANAALLRDMDERKKLEAQLLQAQKMESIGTLAGGVAHDFNNILNIIQAYASVLTEDGAQGNDINESVTVINDTVKRGSALVQQLLTVARRSGGTELELLNLNVLVEGLLPLLREIFPKTIDLICSLKPDLPPIMADKNQIEQALLNLCVNSRDAMPHGGRLTFKTQSFDGAALQPLGDPQQRYVCIEVNDVGVGIDESIRERIFEPFFTTKDKTQGSGLGLSMVYGIVKSHNGFVDVKSKPVVGTSFRLYFPTAPVEMTAKEPAVVTAAETTSVSKGAGTILLAEDEASMLYLLEKIFLRRGYKVLKANNGQAALDIYQQHKKEIQVVLLDIGLPKISGRDVLLKIRSENPDVKVIVTSGYIEPAMKAEIDQHRVKFLHKPYTPDDVFKTLRSLTETTS